MNQIYKKEKFIIIPVCNNYIVINTEKVFKQGHTHIRNIGVARMVIDLAIDKKLPKNPCFVDNLIRISNDKEYIKRLQKFKSEKYIYTNDCEKLMSAHSYKRIRGAIRQIR